MADRLRLLPRRKTTKKRTNPSERPCFDPMAVDDQAVITLSDSEEETGMGALVVFESGVNEQVSEQYQADAVENMVDPLLAMVLVEPIIRVASIPVKDRSVVHPFGVDDASIVGEKVDLYRSVFDDMGVDLDVPIAIVV
ncbi:hypothetical protein AMTRI_Chr11g155450 [Amborella trichopoda]